MPQQTLFRLLREEFNLFVKPSSFGKNAIKGIRFKRPEWSSAGQNPQSNRKHLEEISELILQTLKKEKPIE